MNHIVLYQTSQGPEQQLGAVRRSAVLILAILFTVVIILMQLKSCQENPPDWWPGQNRAELKAENAELRQQNDEVVRINQQNTETQQTLVEAEKASDKILTETKSQSKKSKAKFVKIEKDTAKAIGQIETSTTLTESEKDQQVIEAAFDGIWKSYCQISGNDDVPECAGI